MKIFGFRSDLAGDSIMILSALTYFERLYPNSYKIFHLLGKVHQIAPIFFNHPLIDRVKISKNLESYDEQDYELMKSCDIVINTRPQHDRYDWYNKYNCVDETIRMAGIDLNHFNSILTEEEKRPKLYKYFPVGLFKEQHAGYCKKDEEINNFNNIISVKPFCGYGRGYNRGANKEYWIKLINLLIDQGYEIHHYGFINEPILSDSEKYKRLVNLSFFDQIKGALGSKLIIGHDCGFMWACGGYSYKAIHLLTRWQLNHTENDLAFAPVNVNAVNLFAKNGCDNISQDLILEKIKEII